MGSILAAKIIGRAGLVTGFGSKSHFASYTGTAPVEASSATSAAIDSPAPGTAS